MSIFRRRRKELGGAAVAAVAEPSTTCPHTALVPHWDSSDDIGNEDKATNYVCSACGEEYTREEERTLRSTEADRIRRGLISRPDLAVRYPTSVRLSDRREVELRPLADKDRAGFLRFARELPVDDLLFLREDICDPWVAEGIVSNVGVGQDFGVVATSDDAVVGYASLNSDRTRWTRNVGEIRVIVAKEYRGNGLGGNLVREIIRAAPAFGSRKITAQMTVGQAGARSAFERLGFHEQAILSGWVTDRRGLPRDLLVMALDLADPESGQAS